MSSLPHRPSGQGQTPYLPEADAPNRAGDTAAVLLLQCFLNTWGLRPTASGRIYARTERCPSTGGVCRRGAPPLAQLAEEDPDRLKGIVPSTRRPSRPWRSGDEELFRLFIDYLSFETSEGVMRPARL